MYRDTAKRAIADHACELRSLGVQSLSLVGSVARDEDEESSDVDVLIELVPGAHVGLFGLAEIQLALERILGGRSVDIVLRDAMHDELEASILAGAVPCLGASGSSD